jgi:hypothetical protein
VHNLAWKVAWVLTGRAGEALLDTYEQERRPLGLSATAGSVENFDGLLDVLAALGISRRAVRGLPAILQRLPGWIPRRPVGTLLDRLSALGYQRFRLSASSGRVGRRIRQRAAATIARQGAHYRSWGRDLGERYAAGAIVPDGLPDVALDPEYYTPSVRAGARLPHVWIDHDENRLSTLDLVSTDRLTLLVSAGSLSEWSAAAADLPIAVRDVSDGRAAWTTDLGRTESEALLVRPDGHIAALLRHGPDAASDLRCAVSAVRVASPTLERESA